MECSQSLRSSAASPAPCSPSKPRARRSNSFRRRPRLPERPEAHMKKLFAIALFALAVGVVSAQQLYAQEPYPSRPITMVVPYPPGGVTDTLARLVAEHMRISLGQPVVIENLAGAGGSVGTGPGARAAPDGYTIVLSNSENFVLNPVVLTLQYDAVADFEPVVQLPAYPFLIVS